MTGAAGAPASLGGGAPLFPLVILFSLQLLDQATQSAFNVLIPNVRDAFHLSNAEILLIVALAGAAALLGTIPVAWLADRTVRVTIALVGAGVGAAFSVALGPCSHRGGDGHHPLRGLPRSGGDLPHPQLPHRRLLPGEGTTSGLLQPPGRPLPGAVERRAHRRRAHRGVQLAGPLPRLRHSHPCGGAPRAAAAGAPSGPLRAGGTGTDHQSCTGRSGGRGGSGHPRTPSRPRSPPTTRSSHPRPSGRRGAWSGRSACCAGSSSPCPSWPPPSPASLPWPPSSTRRPSTSTWSSAPFWSPRSRCSSSSDWSSGPASPPGWPAGACISCSGCWRWQPWRRSAFAVLFALAPNVPVAFFADAGIEASLAIVGPGVLAALSLAIPSRARSIGFSIGALFVLPGLVVIPVVGAIGDAVGFRYGMLILVPVFLIGGLIVASAGSLIDADIKDVWLSMRTREEMLDGTGSGRAAPAPGAEPLRRLRRCARPPPRRHRHRRRGDRRPHRHQRRRKVDSPAGHRGSHRSRQRHHHLERAGHHPRPSRRDRSTGSRPDARGCRGVPHPDRGGEPAGGVLAGSPASAPGRIPGRRRPRPLSATWPTAGPNGRATSPAVSSRCWRWPWPCSPAPSCS